MSLTDLYQNTKKDKKETTQKVAFESHTAEIKQCIDSLSLAVAQLQNDVSKAKDNIAILEALDLKAYNDKHARMKASYNELVDSYNLQTAELKSVVLDVSRRLNDIEAKLNIAS